MRTEEYKRMLREEKVLDFETLKETKKQLRINKLTELEFEIDRLIAKNKIQKPEFHNNINDLETNFYHIDLNSEKIEKIVSMFGDLEVETLGLNYETTNSAIFFAEMLDNWNELLNPR